MKALTFIIAMYILSWSCDALATYRVISYVDIGGNKNVERTYTQTILAENKVNWKELTEKPWLPASCDSSLTVQLTDENKYPVVEMEVVLSTGDKLKLSRGEFVICKFTISGNIKISDEAQDSGARGVTISGEGESLIDSESQDPVAGKLHLVREIIPASWRADAETSELKDEIDTAWVLMP